VRLCCRPGKVDRAQGKADCRSLPFVASEQGCTKPVGVSHVVALTVVCLQYLLARSHKKIRRRTRLPSVSVGGGGDMLQR
jgi:hypothetical protein